MILKELLGWLGVLLILTAYSLTTFGVISPADTLYGAMNFLGAAGIIISSYRKRDFQPVFLNVAWIIVATIAIIQSLV